MSATNSARPLNELAKLGEEIFERKVKPFLRPEDDGKFVAIDVDSEDFETDADDYAAVTRLKSRHPDSDAWLVKAGSPAAYRIRNVR